MKDLHYRESLRYKNLMRKQLDGIASDTHIDAKYYLLDLHVTTSPNYLRGRVVLKAASLVDNLDSIRLDLMSAMHVDSVRMGGVLMDVSQHSSNFDIQLDRTYNTGEMLTVEIFYQGLPGSSGFGSFEFSSHGSPTTPWVWSLSEPFGAKDWWPCKDHPSDKADSADIFVTVNNQFKVGSNGKLVSTIDNGDGTVTFHWQEHYPISTYLISVAITNYSQFSNWFKYSPTDSMEVLNYVLPEHLASATSGLPLALDGLRIYSTLFGLYPFINEKYGHSEFGWGGGMEHQTMTSLGGFGESLVMHELAHQWFGDMITCRTWPDIWLNEGFATYCELLYEETKYGASYYTSGINADMTSARSASGTVSVSDSGGTLFSWNLVYAKGAVVLHMLRDVMGDSSFFHAMYNYANNPSLRYGTASTADFRAACESASGMDLAYFFNEWIYGEKFPTYSFAYSSTGNHLTLLLKQATGTTNPVFFTMPVDIRIAGVSWDTTITVWNDAQSDTFAFNLSHPPTSVQIDPQNWILKGVNTVVYSASPDSLNFGSVIFTGTKTDSIIVQNQGTTSLLISSIAVDNSAFSITPSSSANIPGGGSKKYYITFAPDTFGIQNGHVTFVYNGSTSPARISLTGFCFATTALFYTLVDSLDVGYTIVNGLKTNDFRVTNAGATPLVISSASSDNAEFIVAPSSATIQPLEDTSFVVSFHPQSFGTKTAHLTFIHNGTSSPDSVVVKGNCGNITFGRYWNIVSVPLTELNSRKDSLFPEGTTHAYSYTPGSGYVIEDSLHTGKGYWLKFPNDGTVVMDGTPLLSDTFDVHTGWNLIGSVSSPVKTTSVLCDPPGIITSRFYGFDLRYHVTDTIWPGKGYWVKVNHDAKLILSPLGHSSTAHTIQISSNAETPPPPPASLGIAQKDIPSSYSLGLNYPNPFNPVTNISYSLPERAMVRLVVYNTLGQVVGVPEMGYRDAGIHTVAFDGSNLPSGVYVYRLTAGAFSDVKKMMLLR